MTADDLCAQLHHNRISVSQLATEMGLTDRAVRWWKAGQRGIPQEAVVRALDRIVAQRDGYRRGRADAAAAAQKAILECSPTPLSGRTSLTDACSDAE
ncbi:MAG: hypothetical protein ACYC63_05690 [Armatimonadota bacterium]